MKPLRSLVRLRHVGGARKDVELLGYGTERGGVAQLHWPLAGVITVRLRDGKLLELPGSLTAAWEVPREVLEQLRAGYDDWRADERRARRVGR